MKVSRSSHKQNLGNITDLMMLISLQSVGKRWEIGFWTVFHEYSTTFQWETVTRPIFCEEPFLGEKCDKHDECLEMLRQKSEIPLNRSTHTFLQSVNISKHKWNSISTLSLCQAKNANKPKSLIRKWKSAICVIFGALLIWINSKYINLRIPVLITQIDGRYFSIVCLSLSFTHSCLFALR